MPSKPSSILQSKCGAQEEHQFTSISREMQMLGNVTKFVWNTVDPRPVYKKMTAAASKAARYESFDTGSFGSSLFSSSSSIGDLSGITGSSLFSSSTSDLSGLSTSSLFSSSTSDLSGFGSNFSFSSISPSSISTPSLGYFGNPTYTPISDLSNQTMYNIVFTCNNMITQPPPTNLTPDQLQKRQANTVLCQKNANYFCKYIQDTSASFSPNDYLTLTTSYCQPAGPSLTTTLATTVSSMAGLGYFFLAVGALLCASLAANQMLYMPALMRLFVFLVVFAISFINPFFMGGVLLYYVFQIFLDIYRHSKGITNMDQFIVPATLLPLRLRRPMDGFFTRVFLAPFTYIDPSPSDPGRIEYINGASAYVNRLQHAAGLSDTTLETANMKGMKEGIVKGITSVVEAITREGQAAAAAAAVAAAAAGNSTQPAGNAKQLPAAAAAGNAKQQVLAAGNSTQPAGNAKQQPAAATAGAAAVAPST